MKKILLVLCLLGIFYIPMSCGEECKTSNNNITALTADFGYLQPEYFNFFLRDSTTFDSAAFSIQIIEIEQVSLTGLTTGFYPTLHAEEPLDCPTRLHHQLLSIDITATNDIIANGLTYTAGESLTALFQPYFDYDYSRAASTESLISMINSEEDKFSEAGRIIFFDLDQRINQRFTGSFRFDFNFDNGTVSASSATISILP